jgi:sugar lactone lactonase YvrE
MKRFFSFLFFCVPVFLNFHLSAQVIITLAGTGTLGHTGDGGPATIAEVNTPSGIAADRTGNVYFTDQNGNCVRKVDTAGIITTIAGSGASGYSGDSGPATSARLYWPQGLAIGDTGDIFIADQFNNVIRKVNAVTHIITTIAGNNSLIGYTGDGGPATAASLWHPADVATDHAGNVYFVDQDNSVARKVNAVTGIITTIAGTNVAGYSGDGGAATAAKLNFPQGIVADSAGNVYIADFYNSRIRRVDATTGVITTVAGNGTAGYSGDGGPATGAELFDASALAIDSSGNIYISDYYNSMIRKVTAATGIITTVAGNGTASYCCDCHMATAAEIYYPQGVAADRKGNVYIADFGNARVRKITSVFDCPTLGIAKQPTEPVRIFPNPSDGQFSVYPGNTEWPQQLVIYNTLGKMVYQTMVTSAQTTINAVFLPAGIYTVYLTSQNDCHVQKIGILH